MQKPNMYYIMAVVAFVATGIMIYLGMMNFPNKNFGGGTVIFFLSFILKFF